jgi:hypothetical protein
MIDAKERKSRRRAFTMSAGKALAERLGEAAKRATGKQSGGTLSRLLDYLKPWKARLLICHRKLPLWLCLTLFFSLISAAHRSWLPP